MAEHTPPIVTHNESLAIHAEAVAIVTAALGDRPDKRKVKWDHPFGARFEVGIKAVQWDNRVKLVCRHLRAVLIAKKQNGDIPAHILAADATAVKLGIGAVQVMAMQKMGAVAA